MSPNIQVFVYPLEQIVLNGVSVRLGAMRAQVEGAIGPGQDIGRRTYYFDGELAADFDRDGKLEFLEFLAGAEGRLRPVIYGVSAFEASADELAELLLSKAGAFEDTEQGHCFVYPRISVGLYRETTPEDVAEMILEMKENGSFVDDYDLVIDEREKASHWSTLGIGIVGYYP